MQEAAGTWCDDGSSTDEQWQRDSGSERLRGSLRGMRHPENEIYRIAHDRIAESWGEGDWLGTLRQLGAGDRMTVTRTSEPQSRRHHHDGRRPRRAPS